ncbi:hypothetical protein MVLG_06757 [Microbotryum lychnidis-dioicae p1A1 Lamole]|uniref:Uncharacterized protein n=1 Tax=Microbotryum lychnidis-dioicae (strain p1A1 Lamole / MvSl-1064) TaxID=683840 RepID=U5HI93_USTV1|nr:hypothetical protein MVLG_06757 [Microbotryum lychnidis-dioicae p1A1 Lamole]|eukprot:KDE02713.1 hypothetical protein MVLG_06757 [Microbotryum lychnidis-dioicae p1A1 Lamole]
MTRSLQWSFRFELDRARPARASDHNAKPLTTSTTAASRSSCSQAPPTTLIRDSPTLICPRRFTSHRHRLNPLVLCGGGFKAPRTTKMTTTVKTSKCLMTNDTTIWRRQQRRFPPGILTARRRQLNRIDYQPHLVATTSDQPDPLKSESKAEVTDAFILTNRDDDDDDDDDDVGDKPRKRRRTDISLAVSDTEGTEDITFQVMHSKPQYSTPCFDGPSNPPNAASGQDGLSVSAATISARLDRVEIQLAQLVDVLTVPSLDNIKSDVGSAAKIFVSTPFLCKHHGAAPMFAAALR